MPYIDYERRKALRNDSIVDRNDKMESAGELNYQLTLLCIDYMEHKGLSYQTCNDIVGALDNCKDEFRRRIQHPYEKKKCKTSGDVY